MIETKNLTGEGGCCCGSQRAADAAPQDAPTGRSGQDLARGSCCASAAGEPSCGRAGAAPPERPGYKLWPFVKDFAHTPAGPVPRIEGQWRLADRLGAVGVRLGFGRNAYRVAPGLYAVGAAGPHSPVLVTANYKLTFDVLRRAVAGLDAWILVLETHGVNVWCAAGKKTFSTGELVRRITLTGLDRVVSHRTVVVPQLGAVGVSAREVRRQSGFRAVFGPVRADDLPEFLRRGQKADAPMRRVRFPLRDRLAVSLVEFWLEKKTLAVTALALFLLAGLGEGVFSFSRALTGLGHGLTAYCAGFLAGNALTPLLLPWLPGRAFSLKGALAGAVAGLACLALDAGRLETWGLWLGAVTAGSWYAMHYTGSSTYTSPSGVEREMRRALPWQAAGLVAAAAAWRAGLGGWL